MQCLNVGNSSEYGRLELEIEEYISNNKCEVIGKFECVTKTFYVYKTVHKGIEITFCQAPLGGAGAVQIMEQLIAGGATEIIAAGCCGALVADVEEYNERNWENEHFAYAMKLAFDAVVEVS